MGSKKFTEGKWESMDARTFGVPHIIFVNNETILQSYGENSEANVNLVKNAPNMYALLLKILNNLENEEKPFGSDEIIELIEQINNG